MVYCLGLNRHVVQIPSDLVLPDIAIELSHTTRSRPANEQDLIDFVFEKPLNKLASYEENRAILALLNEDILRINETVLKQIDGKLNSSLTYRKLSR